MNQSEFVTVSNAIIKKTSTLLTKNFGAINFGENIFGEINFGEISAISVKFR